MISIPTLSNGRERLLKNRKKSFLWKNSDKENLILDTDESKIYQSVIKKNEELSEMKKSGKFSHRLTNSKVERNYQNKLFPCNYIDRQIRKDMAEHVRETVQFGRDMNNSMERFNIYKFWHNFMKPYRINSTRKNKSTHAEQAGFERLAIKEIITSVFEGFRIRFSQIEMYLNPFEKRCWTRGNHNPLNHSVAAAGFMIA